MQKEPVCSATGYLQADWLIPSASQKGAGTGVEEGTGVRVLVGVYSLVWVGILVCVGRAVSVEGIEVGVLVDVGSRFSVSVGLATGRSDVGVASGGERKLQARINPTKTRLKGMIV